MSWGVWLFFLLIEYLFFIHVNTYMFAHQALGVNMTLNEFNNPERYTYLFDIERFRKNSDETEYKYIHKKVQALRHLVNPFIFLLFSCTERPLRRMRELEI